MSVERKPFSHVFGDLGGRPRPEVTVRRLNAKDMQKYDIRDRGCPVGLFWGRDLIAQMDFDDLFDADGNRFYND